MSRALLCPAPGLAPAQPQQEGLHPLGPAAAAAAHCAHGALAGEWVGMALALWGWGSH